MALLPAFGFSGSAEMVTKAGLNRTCNWMVDRRGALVAGLEASHLQKNGKNGLAYRRQLFFSFLLVF